jgi:hypothetical protein
VGPEPALDALPNASGALLDARLLTYDVDRFPFARLVAGALSVSDPTQLHLERTGADAGVLRYSDNVDLRRELRARLDESTFFDHYRELLRTVVAPLFGTRMAYSRRPQFRVHLAGSPSASAWHTDQQVTGRDDQINVWLPFADTCPANTLWVETDYGRGDYTPISVRYGQMLLFDGGRLAHGTVSNTSALTRVSMDFRFAPLVTGVLQDFFPRRPQASVPSS